MCIFTLVLYVSLIVWLACADEYVYVHVWHDVLIAVGVLCTASVSVAH